jgi:MraZ protein
MSLILGTEYCKVDSNGRFKFPIAFKKQLETEESRFYIRRGITPEYLELWTNEDFKNVAEKLSRNLNEFNTRDRGLKRRLLQAHQVELDNSDRMLIPGELLKTLGDTKEIVLQGTGDYIEIWNRSVYNEMMNDENYDLESEVNERLGKLYDLSSASDAK